MKKAFKAYAKRNTLTALRFSKYKKNLAKMVEKKKKSNKIVAKGKKPNEMKKNLKKAKTRYRKQFAINLNTPMIQ